MEDNELMIKLKAHSQQLIEEAKLKAAEDAEAAALGPRDSTGVHKAVREWAENRKDNRTETSALGGRKL